MSTIPQSTVPLDSALGTSGAPPTEIYGGENLPVLIRLPDLSAAAECVQPATDEAIASGGAEKLPTPESSGADGAAGEPATIPLADSESEAAEIATTQPVADESASKPQSETRLRQQRQLRRERAARRSERQTPMPSWLRGIGQLVLAAALAGVLLAIVITLKNWNAKDGADHAPPSGVPFVEAPKFDFGDPTSGPAADVQEPRGPDLKPPTFTQREPTLENVFPAGPPPDASNPQGGTPPAFRREPARSADSVPAAFRGRRHAATAPQYPTTGFEPAVAVPAAPAGNGVRGWREPPPAGPVRSAKRPPLPNGNPQRSLHR